ncbi:uncharacterized protein LOC117182728 [Belonocnema kinseyi]|uniref:uncharacterized protein LOC117182728 n=1 Tax=Belonocnema kinseyi TaxID=2817044 RepID=UPI00143D3D16|nr:uncharacterized protein LOC117182728 [Belonocnema kinseyi]
MSFSKEIQALEKIGQPINPTSRIITLNPFFDDKGVLRVGGRLQNSSLTFSQKHGAILPKNNHVTDLIIQHEHLSHLHAGVQTTLYTLGQNYRPVDGRNQVRKNIRKCHRCCRANPPPTNYIIWNLPKARISGDIRPFINVGVDYCGPFYIKEKKYRNRSKVKVYVAVFICMAVTAVHLELVSDLTTAGFIAALDRLIARRGKPSKMYSDNGTNFTGANNELREIVASLQIPEQAEQIMTHLTNQGIDWQFTPPLSPHFGGIWEGAVKSFNITSSE